MTDLPNDAGPGPAPLPHWFSTLRRVVDAVTAGLNVLGTLLIVAIMVLINFDVVGRSVFGAPVSGVPEIVSMSIVAIVFLQVAQAFRKGRLTRSEAILNFVNARSPRLKLTMELLFSGAAIVLIWQLIAASVPLFEKAWVRNTFQGTVGDFTAPIWPVKLIILIGCGALMVQLVMFGLAAAIRLLPGQGQRMSPFEIGLTSFGAMVVMVYIGLWVPFALMLASYVGVWMIKGSPALAGKLLALAASETISSYFFGVVPLFVLMGYIVSVTGMGRDAFDVANHLFRRMRGGLGIGTVGANAIFAAITGISIASAAVFTRVAVPEMIRHGYSKRFSVGVVAGSSVLGMLIPPSLLLILYGLLTEQSVGDLFIAGVLPGLLLAFIFGAGIYLTALLRPAWLGTVRADDDLGRGLTRRELGIKGLPIATLIGLVLGGIYGGFFTPIEAGAVGCAGAIIIGLARRSLGLKDFWQVLNDTGLVTASICFLIIAAQMYSRMLALSGVPMGFGNFVATAEIGYWGVILAYVALVIVMGTILDSSSIMLILVPLMLPVLATMQVDLVWFGIVTIIAVEIGLLTPPFGISVFVIKSALDDPSITLGDIFIGAAPFAVMMLIVLALVLAFPALATALI